MISTVSTPDHPPPASDTPGRVIPNRDAALRATLHAQVAEIPATEAENAGWEQLAMPAMLAELGLSQAPPVGWFVAAVSPLYDKAEADGWRYCHMSTNANEPDLLGIAFGGDEPEVWLRADMSLPRTIRTLGHELFHLAEFARGEPVDEHAADEFGATAAARFWQSQYR